MTRAIIESVLEKTLKELPEDFVMKAESVPNYLKKRGVKEEELKFSKVLDSLPNSGRVSKKDLEQAYYAVDPSKVDKEAAISKAVEGDVEGAEQALKGAKAPKTRFETQVLEGSDAQYVTYSVPRALRPGAKYQEKVLKFIDTSDPVRWVNPDHFEGSAGQNYLLHTRVYRDKIGDKETHVIQEVQSDLHQTGRKAGYTEDVAKEAAEQEEFISDQLIELRKLMRARENEEIEEDAFNAAYDTIVDTLEAKLPGLRDAVDTEELMHYTAEEILEKAAPTKVPKSPFEKTWLRKAIERETADAIALGREQIAVPLTGAGIQDTVRSSGVQKWYETTVASTLKKFAKQIGGQYKEVEQPLIDLDELRTTADPYEYLKKERPGLDAATVTAAEGLARLAKTLPDDVLKKNWALLEDAAADFRASAFLKKQGAKAEAFEADTRARKKALEAGVPAELLKDESFIHALKISKLKTYLEPTKYATVEIPKGKDLTFTLYSPVTVGAFGAYQVLKARDEQGNPLYTEDQVKEYLLKERDLTEEEANAALAIVPQIEQAKQAGYTDEEIKQYLATKEVPEKPSEVVKDPEGANNEAEKSAIELLREAEATSPELIDPETFVAKLNTLVNDNGDLLRMGRAMFSPEAAENFVQIQQANEEKIKSLAAKHGIALFKQDGEWMMDTPSGPAVVTPGLLTEMAEAKGELVGGLAGAAVGLRAGAAVPGPLPVKAIGSFAGSIAGAAAGSAVGTQLDYLAAAIELDEEYDAQLALQKGYNSAALSAFFDVVGVPVVSAASKAIKFSYKSLRSAIDMARNGNTDGAYRALKELFHIDDEQARTIVKSWEMLNKKDALGKNEKEKALSTLITTRPGGELVVRAVAGRDSSAAATISREITERARSLQEAAQSMTAADVGKVLRDDLTAYQATVKTNYGLVKEEFINAPAIANRKFSAYDVALKPALKEIQSRITDPTFKKRFVTKAKAALKMSNDRSPESLLELRKLVNEFKSNKKLRKPDIDMLNSVLDSIDAEIATAAKELPEGEKWLEKWRKANADYATMKAMEKNVLFRAVTRPGVSESTIAKALVKYVNAIDNTYEEVLQKIPPKSRGLVEGKIIDELVEKYTGKSGNLMAVDFPALAKELEGTKFFTAEAAKLRTIVKKMAEVYQNDPVLAQISASITIPKFSHYLSTDIMARAHFEMVNTVWNKLKSMAPTKAGDNLALVDKVAKLLETPTNAKTAKELLAELDYDPRIEQAIKALQQAEASARAAGKEVMPFSIKLYPAGNGLYNFTGRGAAKSVAPHKIATKETAENIIGKKIEAFRQLTPEDRQALKEAGYDAILFGEQAGLL